MSELLAQEFFAPASADLVDTVVAQYRAELAKLDRICDVMADGLAGTMHYFIAGNGDERERYALSVDKLFRRDGAVAALNAHYWRHVMELTDVLDCMPAKRREEWFEQIRAMTTPDFEDATVRATLGDLLAQRGHFLAERVDGIFQALSRTHITNQPEGFSKRMILTGVTNDWGSYARAQTGHINDLRAVVAKLMKRDEPDWNASNQLVEIARRDYRGQWLDVDGGALRIRCYLNGNAHMEVHPDIAWQLNQILAMLHPHAIPSRFRTKPKRTATREYTLMDQPLPFAVIGVLANLRTVRGTNHLELRPGERDKHVGARANEVLFAMGGVRQQDGGRVWYEFDYDPMPVLGQIIASGCIPDQKSHQFYPTPPALAAMMVAAADIGDADTCLEPSAGTGAIADLLPKDRTTCVEVSALHASVLAQKGHAVTTEDFLAFAASTHRRWDRIVMNPPFSQGRWKAHVDAAAALLSPGGKLVAVIPASAHGKFQVDGLSVVYDGPHENKFSGTSIAVTILNGDKGSGLYRKTV